MRTSFASCAGAAVLCLLPLPAMAQSFRMADYWFMPPNTYKDLHTVYRSIPGNPNCSNPEMATHTFWRGTFMGQESILLQGGRFDTTSNHPGYDIFQMEGNGRILYWGTFRGNLPTDEAHAFTSPGVWMNPTMTAGAGLPSSIVSETVQSHELTNRLRRETNSGNYCYAITVAEHLDHFTNPEDPDAYPWPDVLHVLYTFGDCSSSLRDTEDYWLAKGVGTIRFQTSNAGEPSCVDRQWASSSPAPPEPYSGGVPEIPWYDPFRWETYVKNGFFEDPPTGNPPPTAGILGQHARSWTGWSGTTESGTPNTADVVLSSGGLGAAGSWYAALRVLPNAGWDQAVSDPIEVTSNATYRLSGWLYRSAGGSNDVYLDMDDLETDGVLRDVNIGVSSVGAWEHVSGDICVGSANTVKVRCVRDTANTAEAGCDGVTLQRVGVCDGGGGGGGGGGDPGGSGGSPGCLGGYPDGVCQHSEKYVVLHEDGTSERLTMCPEDCPSCGSIGGDHCSQTSSCPAGFSPIQATYDCTACCAACTSRGCPAGTCGWQTDNCGSAVWCGNCLPTCGAMGGNYCSQSASCPAGFNSLGQSSDCTRCCKSCTSTGCPAGTCGWRTDNCGNSIYCGNCLPTCGAMGGNYCSQSASCPAGYNSLGQSSDCTRCCKSCTSTGCPAGTCGWRTDNCGKSIYCGTCLQSCGQMGGTYCSQSGSCPAGYDSLGRSSDCQTCCQQGPSCGALGGDYCSQNGSCPGGYSDYGRTWDCNHCCASS